MAKFFDAAGTAQSSRVQVNETPDKCPLCHHACLPQFIEAVGTLNPTPSIDVRVQALFKCPLRKCSELFLADYYKSLRISSEFGIGDNEFCLFNLAPRTIDKSEITKLETVEKVSPRFYSIYFQALEAQSLDLDEIAGPGFRKALEILVKDFLINQKPSEKEAVLAAQLAPCIKMIEHPKLQSMCDRATWLGNDETHYSRKWVQLDVEHLKAIIQIVVQWIHTVLETENWEAKMPKPVKGNK